MMKKRWIAVSVAAGMVLLGGVSVYAVKSADQTTVTVVPISMITDSGYMYEGSLSGTITSDVSQNVYLADSQQIKEIFVEEGDTVQVGDDLVSYDMTLENLDLEMRKLEKESIELNIEKARREITKLRNTKPTNNSGWNDPVYEIPEEPIEEPEEPILDPEEVVHGYSKLTKDAQAYMGEGTLEEPYHFLCTSDGVILGSFLNRMAEEQCFFVIEVREGDVSNGELLRIWGQQIKDDTFQTEDDARYQLDLKKEEISEKLPEDVQRAEFLEKGAKSYKGDGTQKNPLTYLLTENGIVKGSFFLEKKEEGKFFRIEVRNEKGELLEAWEQNGAREGFAEQVKEDSEYLVVLSQKQNAGSTTDPGEQPGEAPGGTTPGGTTSGGTIPGETKPEETPGGTVPGETPGETTDPEEIPRGNSGETGVGETTGEIMPEQTSGNSPEGIENMSLSRNGQRIRGIKTVSSVMEVRMLSVDTSAGGGTAQEIQQQIKEKEKEIRDYQLDLKEKELEIKDIQKKLKNQTIKSTINGTVKTVGDPENGNLDGKPFVQVVSSEGLYVEGTVSESMLDQLKEGTMLDGYCYDNGVSFTAEIREVSEYPMENGDYGPNSSSYPFTAYIADASGLSNYSWTELTIQQDEVSESAGIYLEKPFVRTEDGQYYVMIKDENGRLKKQVVQIGGILYGYSYQITQGLTMDDQIAFPYGKNVREGVKTEDGTLEDIYS